MTVSQSRMFFVVAALFASTVGCPAGVADAQERQSPLADTVLLGGKILTVDGRNSVAQAIAVRGGKIQAVGTNAEIKRLVGNRTRIIELNGKTVVPGLIETHCHAIGVGRNALLQPFVEFSSIGGIQAWLRKRAKEVPKGRWLVVPRVPITRLKERRHPTIVELDAGCSTHPVIFTAARKNVLNSTGLKRVGITRETESIPGGTIIRDSDGNVRMISRGDSHLRKFRQQREFSEEETLAGLAKVISRYNASGITSIFERATNLEGYKTYTTLRDRGQLNVRATLTFRQQFQTGEQVEEYTKKLGMKTGDGDDWVRVGPLKITLDGGIHWGTVRLREPYGKKRSDFYVLGDPDYRGDLRYSVDQMQAVFKRAHQLGWQMCVHVTGDAAVDRLLDALEAVDREVDVKKRRFTLTHAYFPAQDSIKRMKRLGMCVDTQSFLYYKDADAMAKIYGRSWAGRLIGVGDWFKGGIPIAINSDHMIGLDPDHAMNSFNPFLMLYIAVSRKDEFGNVYGPRQKVSRADALKMITSFAAYLSFDEDKKGSLEPGKFADLVVIDRDYLTCPVEDIRKIQVLTTMVDGKIVYERKTGRAE